MKTTLVFLSGLAAANLFVSLPELAAQSVSPSVTSANPRRPIPPANALVPVLMGRPYANMPIEWSSEAQMHQYFNTIFLAAEGNGMSRMITSRMQLQDSMRLVLAEKKNGADASATTFTAFQPDDLELIGIAKHPTPVAFVKGSHQSASADAQTRALTDYEQTALGDLRSGKEVIFTPDSAGGRIVIGAIRADPSCLECHSSAKSGDLLGAFSYHLQPSNRLTIDNMTARLTTMQDDVKGMLENIKKTDPAIHNGQIERVTADIAPLLADVAGAEDYVKAHPEINPFPFSKGNTFAQRAQMTQVPVFALPGAIETAFRGGRANVTSRVDGNLVRTTLAKPNAQGLMIGADGKVVSGYLVLATSWLTIANGELANGPGDGTNRPSIGELGGYRDKIRNELGQLSTDLVAGLVYVHDNYTPPDDLPKPTVTTSPAPPARQRPIVSSQPIGDTAAPAP